MPSNASRRVNGGIKTSSLTVFGLDEIGEKYLLNKIKGPGRSKKIEPFSLLLLHAKRLLPFSPFQTIDIRLIPEAEGGSEECSEEVDARSEVSETLSQPILVDGDKTRQ